MFDNYTEKTDPIKIIESMPISLLSIWEQALASASPQAIVRKMPPLRENEATLFIGKAARMTFLEVARQVAHLPASQRLLGSLVISPSPEPKSLPKGARWMGVRWIQAEHPLPGAGSLEAGLALLDFFDWIRRQKIPRLRVFLSGGASSLMWLPPAALSFESVSQRLRRLYSRALSIRELNQERARLCCLKEGGAAHWLGRLAPWVRAEVEVISDVAPFGAQVVGSGPFWDGKILHRVLADNRDLIKSIELNATKSGLPVRSARHSLSMGCDEWVRTLKRETEQLLKKSKPGLLVLGGEPILKMKDGAGRGGRQTQIAALLAQELATPLLEGRIEILCGSSDGSDGRSRSGGAYLHEGNSQWLSDRRARHRLKSAIARMDSASFLEKVGALLPERETGTNVQDATLVLVRPW